ncbi:MAG: iron-sulfur cluster assembly accessory protein [Verrucomicrobiaceae bacterium]|nr:iron-sulfur cluster assembly accessory protein [Verrucomicrobiaceae bacterium]
MISLTPSAVTKIRELVGTHSVPSEAGLRLDIEKGGCAGFQYIMKIMGQVTGDQVVEQDGVRVFVSEGGKPYLDGCTLDFVDSLSDGGFRIENPNATRSCGCGTSFEPKGNVTK